MNIFIYFWLPNRDKWFNLLYNLKSTVEGLLCMPCANVWSVYGGLQRVTNNIYDILNHQLNYSCAQVLEIYFITYIYE